MNEMSPNPDFGQLSNSEDEDRYDDSSIPAVRTGAIIAGLFFIGVLGWAAFVPLDAGAIATGTVAVSGNRQAVQHREGGILTRLDVVEGQMVEKDQPLVEVSASEVVATERSLSGEVIALLALRARLLAERDRHARLAEPEEFQNLSAEDEALALDALQGQRLLFEARRSSLAAERGVLSQRIAQHGQQISGVRSQISSNRRQRELIAQELDGLRSLIDRGFVSMNRVRAIERNAAQLEGDFGSYEADIARTQQAAGEARMQILSLEKQMAEGVATELRQTQIRLAELQPKLTAAREQLKRSTVRAPAAGRVVGLSVFTVGGVVSPGEKMMEIVPQNRALVVDGKISPTDADDLYVGMETQVRFSALQQRNLPILKGKISKVSADGFEDPRTGERFFKIEVVVSPAELAKIVQVRGDTGLRAGLPAEVMIPLRKRTALSYLVEPLTQTLWLAGREH
ncbi:MAG: HlyD family type I secretion periplasmic adaptor subunit [Sphingorhabdus sp.]